MNLFLRLTRRCFSCVEILYRVEYGLLGGCGGRVEDLSGYLNCIRCKENLNESYG